MPKAIVVCIFLLLTIVSKYAHVSSRKGSVMAQAERVSAWQSFQQRTKHGDSIFWLVTLFFALLVIALVFAVGYVTWAGSTEARAKFGIGFLFQTGWDPNAQNFGALPAIYGTVVSS